MNILIYQRPTDQVGQGHQVRCEELASVAMERGHRCATIYSPPGEPAHEVRERMEAAGFRPDWLLVDLPGELPDAAFELAEGYGAMVCNLDGQGEGDDERPALTIVQSAAVEKVSDRVRGGPGWVVLRRRLFTYLRHNLDPRHKWFVYGGSGDQMGLVPMFLEACSGWPAYVAGDIDQVEVAGIDLIKPPGSIIFSYIASCRQACVQMGMTAWECAALGLPAKVFSPTEGHLRHALAMASGGLVAAWPEVGLPPPDEFRAFLEEPFAMTGKPPDGRGAERVLELMEG